VTAARGIKRLRRITRMREPICRETQPLEGAKAVDALNQFLSPATVKDPEPRPLDDILAESGQRRSACHPRTHALKEQLT